MEAPNPTSTTVFSKGTGFPSTPQIKSFKGMSKTKAICNVYKLLLTSDKARKSLRILSWSVKLLPEMPLDSRFIHKTVMVNFKRQIQKKIGLFLLSGQLLYTIEMPNVDYQNSMPKLLFTDQSQKEKGKETLQLELTLNPNIYDLNQVNIDPIKNQEILKFLNLIMKAQFQRMGMFELGYLKKYYLKDMSTSLDIGDWKYNLLIGFSSAINILESGLRVNLDYNCRILRGYNLWEEIEFEYERQSGQKKSIIEIAEGLVTGKSFVLTYANDRIVRMNGVNSKMSIRDAFPNKKYKNYADYYLKTYGVKLSDPNQLIVYSINKNYRVNPERDSNLKKDRKGYYKEEIIHFPSELLFPTGLKDETFNTRRFKDRQDSNNMKKITDNTKLTPDARIRKGEDFIRRFNKATSTPAIKNSLSERKGIDLHDDVRLKIESESNNVDALLMQRPKILSGDGYLKVNNNGTYNLRSKVIDKHCQLDNWVLFYDNFQERNVDNFLKNLKKSSKTFNINVRNPVFKEKLGRRVEAQELLDMIQDEDPDITLAVFLVGDRNRYYESVKYTFANNSGISTQFFTDSYKMKNLSVVSKVLLQSIAKQGCQLWTVENGFKKENHKNMLVGVDVINAGRTMGVSMIGTMNKEFDQQISLFRNVELSKKKATRASVAETIADMAKDLAQEFKQRNKKLPKNMIFYRNGSGNSQGLQHDLKFEAQNIRDKIKSMGHGEANLAYFGVAKKTSRRIFQTGGAPVSRSRGGNRGRGRRNNQPQQTSGISNPSGGLIVYKDITQKGMFEFLMVAQYVNQGSATPTHYFCVFDNTGLALEEFLKTTYFQTFNYKNWQGPIRVPAVAMNAERQSKLWAEILKKIRGKAGRINTKNEFTYYL